MTTAVSIAETVITLDTPFLLEDSTAFGPFLTNREAEFSVRVEEAECLPGRNSPVVYQQWNFEVVSDADGRFLRRYYTHHNRKNCCVVSRMAQDEKTVEVFCLPDQVGRIKDLTALFYHIQLENLLLQRDRVILHAACVETALGGLLFSGPSGIGKSTQADLWCQFEGARLLNGDRPILGRRSGVWRAYGSPYAGSSKCYRNESTPVRALILLEQGPACTIRRASCAEAVRRLLEQITLNQWDPAFVSRVCTLLDALLAEIPVYVLRCTPDRRAVDLLRQTLAADGRA